MPVTEVRPDAEGADGVAGAMAFAAARALCRRHARSLFFASALLPRAKRQAAYAVGAFCGMMKEAMSEPTGSGGEQCAPVLAMEGTSSCCSPSEIDARLAMLRDRLDAIYESRLELPLPEFRDPEQHALHALARTVHRYELPKQYFLDLAEGLRMDLVQRRFATWSSLEKYCYHVAGVIGLVLCGVFGATHSDAGRCAAQIGSAMQLTNILRDLREDWKRGRIYLPLEDMARFGYCERDLAAGVINERFRELMAFEISRAWQMYRDGSEGIAWLSNDGSRLAAAVVTVQHSGILDAIERRGFDVFNARVHLTTGQKLRRLPGAWRLARQRPGERAPGAFR